MKLLSQRGAAVLLSFLFFALSGCAHDEYPEGESEVSSEKNEVFLLDTSVSMSLTRGTKSDTDRLTEVIKNVSDAAEECFNTPANKLTGSEHASIIGSMTNVTAGLTAIYDPDIRFIDLYAGTFTRLWGISTEAPRVPGEDEITAALRLMHDARVIDDESGGLYANLPALPDGVFIDPGAVAKGYALDEVFKELETAMDIPLATISTGSSVLHYGEKPDGKPFTTSIKSPFINFSESDSEKIPDSDPENFPDSESDRAAEEEAFIGYIETPAAFISTSGGYERFFEIENDGGTTRFIHIFDPETGFPTETDLVSVTVVVPVIKGTADCGIMSDYLSTLLFMGGSERLKGFDEYAHVFTYVAVGEDGKVYGNQPLLPV
jgi:thiamine biosynthesis lipoprotein